MTQDNFNLELETERSRSPCPDTPLIAAAARMKLADAADILETALLRNAARWQMGFAQRMSRPGVDVLHEPRPETSGSGHSLVVWHTVS